MTRSALLIIDMQVALTAGAWRIDEVLEAIVGLQRQARKVSMPVVFLQHSHRSYAPMRQGAEGWAIHPRLAPRPGDVVVQKTASDGFMETTLRADLDRLGVRRLVVTGMQTEFCVDATCRAALSHGFEVVLAADAHTTGDAVLPAETTIRHHNYALANLAHPRRSIEVMPSAGIGFS